MILALKNEIYLHCSLDVSFVNGEADKMFTGNTQIFTSILMHS